MNTTKTIILIELNNIKFAKHYMDCATFFQEGSTTRHKVIQDYKILFINRLTISELMSETKKTLECSVPVT